MKAEDPRSVNLRMKPEWNPEQTVQLENRSVTVSASPYDVPDSFSMKSDGGRVTITPIYDFNAGEKAVPAKLASATIRVFLGKMSGRVMRIEIDAQNLRDVAKALREAAQLMRSLANGPLADGTQEIVQRESIRRSVHLGMFEQALPMMGPDIEQQLKELRNHAF